MTFMVVVHKEVKRDLAGVFSAAETFREGLRGSFKGDGEEVSSSVMCARIHGCLSATCRQSRASLPCDLHNSRVNGVPHWGG